MVEPEKGRQDMTRTKWVPHDGVQDSQTCRDCGLTLGRGITTRWDDRYYSGDPDKCPQCGGAMGMIVELPDPDATYSVRRPGCTAWADGLTLAEAEREAGAANRTCCPGHIVVED